MHSLHRLRRERLLLYGSIITFLTMKQLLLATAAAAATLLPTTALANNCYMVASYINPDFMACQDSGRRDVYGQKVWICCK